jgi:hypothetical protein
MPRRLALVIRLGAPTVAGFASFFGSCFARFGSFALGAGFRFKRPPKPNPCASAKCAGSAIPIGQQTAIMLENAREKIMASPVRQRCLRFRKARTRGAGGLSDTPTAQHGLPIE